MAKMKTMKTFKMDIANNVMENVFDCEKCQNFDSLLKYLDSIFYCNNHTVDSLTAELIDIGFLEEIRNTVKQGVPVYFGKTLRDLKCIIVDESGMREHEIFLHYKSPRKLAVTSVQLPQSLLQDQEYSTIEEILSSFKLHVDSLEGYFKELERIDRFCTVVEPMKPTFKEDYRRILLDDRIWLHVEVTPEGLATNVHLVGQSDKWQDKLQAGLLNWNHDEDIVENIMTIFDLMDFPAQPKTESDTTCPKADDNLMANVKLCNICLCPEVPGCLGVPQPLCQNTICGAYFHRNCLFQPARETSRSITNVTTSPLSVCCSLDDALDDLKAGLGEH